MTDKSSRSRTSIRERISQTVSEHSVQYAALPYRNAGETTEILLVTSLGTKRWIIPKGWPMEGRAPHEAAAREALEEAGVEGEVANEAIGAYQYDKRRKSGSSIPCRVDVFPLDVKTQRKRWREKGRRKVRWFSPEEAAKIVSDADLGDIIRQWTQRLHAPEAEPAGAD
jgi:8-oxo-dGTP pyrophosphatase MutT (NUDIX family)